MDGISNASVPQFSLSILKTKDGGTIKDIKPDKDGVFRGIPVMVFNKSSRNNVVYDTASIIQAMNNPTMKFRMSLEEGNLRGEYGHPDLNDDTSEKAKRRLLKIDEKMVSHAFVGLRTDQTKSGDMVLYADLTPAGPYGKAFLKDMENSNINKSFSLRALCAKPEFINGVTYKKVLIFVTFDYVNMPGYEKASTRFAVGSTENMDYYVSAAELANMDGICELVGVESIKDQQFLDMFQTDELSIEHHMSGYLNREKGTIVTPNGEVSVFKSLFR